jgi:hypothetical protein
MRTMKTVAALILVTFWCAAYSRAQDRVVVLHGTVVSDDSVVPDGWLAVQSGKILSITKDKPSVANAIVIETSGYIYPGLVDLHNHPMYAVFPRWSPGETFDNRYQWRNDAWYKVNVGVPGKLMQAEDASFCYLNEYGDVRALVGGTTAIHGTSAQKPQPPFVPTCSKGEIRHLDWYSGLRGSDIGSEHVLGLLGVRDASPAASPTPALVWPAVLLTDSSFI